MSCTSLLEPETSSSIAAVDVKVTHRADPLSDARWNELVSRHPRASVFHSVAWLRALSRTYGYNPVVYTTCAPGERLTNGIVFSQVESWLTGRRLVSLPFSDHCDPLFAGEEDAKALASALREETAGGKWRYVEVRPLQQFEIASPLIHTTATYHYHQLDLRPELQQIFRNFHRDSIQRKIRRAERESLRYEAGASEELLEIFYSLLAITRFRHNLPPQPRVWFRNLAECFGSDFKIRIAFKGDRPIAGIITLRHNDALVYKYGCSDHRFHNLGGVQFLLWRSIQEAKNSGMKSFDLGRSNSNQSGLVVFKNRWGASHSLFTYSRYAASGRATHALDITTSRWKKWAATYVLARLQPSVASILGRVLYRHAG